MIVLLGASGYIGSAFASEMHRVGYQFLTPARNEALAACSRAALVVNAAGYTGRPNVDSCEKHKLDCMMGNVAFPHDVIMACRDRSIPILHVSSGCIYNGPGMFSETDPPNFTFDHPPCSWYSGTKALAEELFADYPSAWVCRLRIPFDEEDGPRNYLSKLLHYPKLVNVDNSISHRGDYVKACLDLWQLSAPFGIYNVTNPGFASAFDITIRMNYLMKLGRRFNFYADLEEFAATVETPRSNCLLSTEKLMSAGVSIRPVWEALEDSITRWKKS